jgi:hypothetical protein
MALQLSGVKVDKGSSFKSSNRGGGGLIVRLFRPLFKKSA